jgi:prolipoprotein diacylglyceryltransferase
MYPEIFSIGFFTLRSLNVALVVGLFATAFMFWRRTKEEYYDEDEVMDGFLLSLLVGVLASRVGFIALHWDLFSLNVQKWIDIFGHPGLSGSVGIIAMGLFLFRYSTARKWDAFEVLDYWVIALCSGLSFFWVGAFLDGSNVGTETQLPWGVQFPGLLEPHHPIQLYWLVFFVGAGWFFSWVEYKYRTFQWYRASKHDAESGFIVASAIIAVSIMAALVSIVQPSLWEIAGVPIEQLVSLAGVLYGFGLLYVRSGRSLWFQPKKKQLFNS